jgi:hypothetical protein
MTRDRKNGGALLLVGMLLNLSSGLTARADRPLFGLAGDFWAGFLLGLGLTAMIAAIVLLMRPPAAR